MILTTGLILAPMATAQIGFNNSSFEQPVLSGGTQYLQIFSSTVAPGFNTANTWNVVNGSVDIVRLGSGGYWGGAAADGNQVLDLTGSSGTPGSPDRGTIRQTFNTGTSTSLLLEFAYSRNVDYNNIYAGGNSTFSASVRIYAGTTNYLNTTVSLDASSNGTSITDGRDVNNFLWQTFSQTVTSLPQNTNLTLEFVDTTSAANATNQGLLLDFVRPVPEPFSITAATAAGLLAIRRLRRRAVN